jgi:hypothetical protein
LERFISVAEITGGGLFYSDYYEIENGTRTKHPLIDYQLGSLIYYFDFGPLLFLKTEALKKDVYKEKKKKKFYLFYYIKLKI